MRTVAIATVLALIAAACTSSNNPGDDLSAPQSSDRAPGGQSTKAKKAAPKGTAGTSSPSGQGRQGTGSSRPTPSTILPPSGFKKPAGGGIGVTDATLTIGVHGQDNRGLGTGAAGDQRRAAAAIIESLNANGGIAGRKAKMIYTEFDQSAADWPSAYQANCATYTEDNKVFAVASVAHGQGWQVLARCLANHKTVFVQTAGDTSNVDKIEFDSYAPYFYRPDRVGGHRLGITIDMLHDAGYFDKGAKIGLLWSGFETNERTVSGPIKRRLAHYGLNVSAEGSFTPTRSWSDVPTLEQEGQQYALRFAAEEITHVICVATFGGCGYAFGPAAEAQGYRPRYGLTVQGDWCAPAAQCTGALGVTVRGIGFGAASPVSPGGSPKDEKAWNGTPAWSLCLKILRDVGLDLNSGQAGWFKNMCEGLFFLKFSLDRVSAVTPEGLRAEVDTLGTAFSSTTTFKSRFRPGRYDGAGEAQLFKFDTGCECFKYKDGGRRRIP